MTSAFSWQNSVSICMASFYDPRKNLPVTAGISWLPNLHSNILRRIGHLFLVLVLRGLLGLHRTDQLQLPWHRLLGHCCCCFLVTKAYLTLCDPVVCSMPGFPVFHYLPEFAQTHVHYISHVIQSSYPLFPPCPLVLNLSQFEGLLQWMAPPMR